MCGVFFAWDRLALVWSGLEGIKGFAMSKQMVFNGYAQTLMLVIWLTAVIGPGYSQAALLTNLNNKHNMSSAATHGGPKALSLAEGGTDQICIFCHTPHAAAPESTLWSRPAPDTVSFPLYAQPLAIKGDVVGKENPNAVNNSLYTNTGSTPNGTPVTYPNGASRMCLSCHDGVTAVGILRDSTTIAMAGGLTDLNNPGVNTPNPVIDLSTSHPISFVFNQTVLDDVNSARNNTYKLPDPADSVDTPLDSQSRMQCTTCHDPHDDTQLDNALWPPFWREGNATGYNDVCNACHTGATVGSPPIHSLP
jgi:hypothetical protein